MSRPKTKRSPDQQGLFEPDFKTAPCVSAIRQAVRAWVDSGYSATATTRQLLQHWFHTDHRTRNGDPFAYYPFQREAVETLIYLYEIAKKERHKDLLESYATAPNLRLLQYDQFARYCLKMATGSGKTKVMALAIAWQYFNAVLEDATHYAATTLLLAPNVIVFERLRNDFAGGRIFRTDPVIPPELEIFWELDCYMRGDSERADSQGSLYLTNIQQFYAREEQKNNDEPAIMTLMLGSKPPAQSTTVEPFESRLLKRGGPVFVVNDEAHHTHDEENEWNRSIRRLQEQLQARQAAVSLQLDLSATPRYSKGSLFTWIIFDYPLKQAILDNVVKRPLKGIASGIQEVPSDIASIRYQAYLAAGVERWREYRTQLAPLARKPVLFVMLNSTKESYTDSAANLRYYEPDFVAVTCDGIHHVIETKGREDIDVQHKDRAATLWCENATRLTSTEWQYKIVRQTDFEQLQPKDFEDLIALGPLYFEP